MPGQTPVNANTKRLASDVFFYISCSLFLIWQFYKNLEIEFSLDEYATWWVSHRGVLDSIFDASPFPPHAITYGLTSISLGVFGDSTFGLRFPNLIFTIATVLALRSVLNSLARGKAHIASHFCLVVLYCLCNSTALGLFVARSYGASHFFLAGLFACLLSDKKHATGLALLFAFCAGLNQPALSAYAVFGAVSLTALTISSHHLRARERIAYLVLLNSFCAAGIFASAALGVTSLLKSAPVVYAFRPPLEWAYAVATVGGPSPTLAFLAIVLIFINAIQKGNTTNLHPVFAFLAILTAQTCVLLAVSKATSSNLLMERYFSFSEIIWVLIIAVLVNELSRKKSLPVTIIACFLSVLTAIFMPKDSYENTGWNEILSCLEKQSADSHPLTILFVEHSSALMDSRPEIPVEHNGWLAQLTYVGANRWSDITLLGLRDNDHISTELDKKIKTAVANSQPIILVKATWTPPLFEDLLYKQLSDSNFKNARACENANYKAEIFEKY